MSQHVWRTQIKVDSLFNILICLILQIATNKLHDSTIYEQHRTNSTPPHSHSSIQGYTYIYYFFFLYPKHVLNTDWIFWQTSEQLTENEACENRHQVQHNTAAQAVTSCNKPKRVKTWVFENRHCIHPLRQYFILSIL